MNETLEVILETRIVAIVRSDTSDGLLETVRALLVGGVRVVEVTLNTPGALEAISAAADEGFLIGAGSVLDAGMARAALAAGAEFLVAPNTDVAAIRAAKDAGKVACPGALTPTEVVTAWQAGADLVKIFPASCMGPGYIKALRGPLPHVRTMPVGGVNLDNAAAFLEAGACALGVGGSLVDGRTIAAGDWEAISAAARRYVALTAARA